MAGLPAIKARVGRSRHSNEFQIQFGIGGTETPVPFQRDAVVVADILARVHKCPTLPLLPAPAPPAKWNSSG